MKQALVTMTLMYEGAVAVVIKFAVEGIVEHVNKGGEFVGRFGMTRFRLLKIFMHAKRLLQMWR